MKDDGKVNVMHEKSKKVKKNVPYEKVLKSMFWTGWEKNESFDGGRVMTGNFREFMERAMNDPHYKKKRVDEKIDFIDIWQGKEGDHKSSLSIGKDGITVLGVITHGSKFMFDKKDVPKLLKLLKMKDSPIIKR